MDIFISLLAVLVALSCVGALLYKESRGKKFRVSASGQTKSGSKQEQPGQTQDPG
jgi:hypothetical protein